MNDFLNGILLGMFGGIIIGFNLAGLLFNMINKDKNKKLEDY
jgi:hypothetical protein